MSIPDRIAWSSSPIPITRTPSRSSARTESASKPVRLGRQDGDVTVLGQRQNVGDVKASPIQGQRIGTLNLVDDVGLPRRAAAGDDDGRHDTRTIVICPEDAAPTTRPLTRSPATSTTTVSPDPPLTLAADERDSTRTRARMRWRCGRRSLLGLVSHRGPHVDAIARP